MLEKLLAFRETNTGNEGPITIFPAFDLKPGQKAETEYQHFFEELSGADSHIEFTTAGRILKNLQCLEKLFFTGCPVRQDAHPSPRRFLTEYPEAGGIYAKMIHTRVFINQLRGDKSRKQSALEELWKAQDSAIYSPAGIKNPQVRKAAYGALLEAEKITQERDLLSPSLSVFDYDLDGQDEYVFQDERINCNIKLLGAGLFELDYIPGTWNFLDIFTNGRRNGSSAVRRRSFTEYLVPGKNPPQLNWQGIEGSRFCGNELYEAVELDRVHRQVQFRLNPAESLPLGKIEIKKTWFLKRNVLTLHYELLNTGSQTENFFLVPSVDLSFSGCNDSFLKILAVKNSKETVNMEGQNEFGLEDIGGLEFRDLKNEIVILLEANKHFNARLFNIETANPGLQQADIAAENGKIPSEYQFTCIMPVLPIVLDSNKSWDIVFSLKISS